jgi:hypothetical protein
LIFNRRESLSRAKNQDADAMGKFQEMLSKAQDRSDKLYDEKVAQEIAAEKLRNDLAVALVENADLKTQLAEREGYIQGITDPLIKLEASQQAALRGGRRLTNKPIKD